MACFSFFQPAMRLSVRKHASLAADIGPARDTAQRLDKMRTTVLNVAGKRRYRESVLLVS